MKTYLTYGIGIAAAGFLLNLLLFFTGFHTDVEKVSQAGTISSLVGLAISIVGIVLGTKARRAEVPASENFGYGRALGAGVMISLIASIAGAVLQLVYTGVINPGFNELTVQSQVAAWEAAGMSQSQIDTAESMTRKFMHPAIQAGFILFFGVLFGTIISLVTSAFLRRPATADAPPPVVA